MATKDGHITGVGGLRLFYQAWLPEGVPKATVVLCHGYAEHGARYAHLADYLTARGFALWALDHRGHGRSEGLRTYVERFDAYVEDMRTFIDHIDHAGAKTFLYAHSMGSLIALEFAIRHQEMIDGLILTGTGIAAGEGVSPLLVAVSKLMSVILPKLPVLALDSAALSHDPAVQTAYDSDPLVYRGKMRARLGAEMLRMSEAIKARLSTITKPILIMHGTADSLTPCSGARMAYDGIGAEDKTLKLWEGMYHEVHNEPAVQDEMFALVADWLDAHS